MFRDLSLFGCLRGCSMERIDPDREPRSFRIYGLAVWVHGDLCAPPNRRADGPKEINYAERPGRTARVSTLRLQGPRSKILQNLILHVLRAIDIVQQIPRYFFSQIDIFRYYR